MTKRWIFRLALLLCSVVSGQAWSRVVSSVRFEGVDKELAKALHDKAVPLIGKEFSPTTVEDFAASLYRTNQFTVIEIYTVDSPGDLELIASLVPVRKIAEIKVIGNAAFSHSEVIAQLGLHETEKFSRDRVQESVEQVKQMYNLSGYLNAQVSADFEKRGNDTMAVTVKISEGNPCVVQDIGFKSANESLNKELRGRIKKLIHKNYSQDFLNNLQENIENFLLSERYLTATIQASPPVFAADKTSVNVEFVVTEPYRFALEFEGNEARSSTKLLSDMKLDTNNRLSTLPVDDLTQRLIGIYKAIGYANISVKAQETVFARDFLRRVTFVIKEGAKVRIKDIQVEGTISREAKYYKNYIFDHSGDLIDSKIYNAADLEVGVRNLVTELQNQGFLSAKAVTTRVDFDKRRENVTIRIVLEEGPRTLIQSVNLFGQNKISKDEIEEAISLKAGAPLSLPAVEESTQRLVDLYNSRGYLDARVLNQGQGIIAYSPDNLRADLIFKIYEGPQVRVASILIEGNDFTKDYVVRRELEFQPGDVLTPEKTQDSIQKLQRLGIFNGIEIRTLEEHSEQASRTVLVKLVERNPGIFRSGIGVNNELGLSVRGFVGTAYSNLFGTGRLTTARVQLNAMVQDVKFVENETTLGYVEPYVFNTRWNARVNLTRATKLYNTIDNAKRDQEVGFLLEQDITKRLKFVYTLYDITQTSQFNIYTNATSQDFSIGSTGPKIVYDRRDNPFNPTTGDYSTLGLEYADPLLASSDTVRYLKTVGSYSRYFKLLKQVVWANEFGAGYEKNFNTLADGAIPEEKAFILGGRSTIRGYDPNAFPRQSDFPAQQHVTVTTDSYFTLIKTELRFPLYGNLGGVVFYDGGSVLISPLYEYRDSIGIGIRYNTPVGPVSLEYGQKLNKRSPDEAPGRFHFAIGVF